MKKRVCTKNPALGGVWRQHFEADELICTRRLLEVIT